MKYLHLIVSPLLILEESSLLSTLDYIYIDHKLSWERHIDHVVARIRPMIYVLFRIRGILNVQHLLQLYYAHVHSYLSYLTIVWARVPKFFLNRAKVIQNKKH